MPVSYPNINGMRMDYSSIEISVGSMKRVLGVKEISYKATVEPGYVYGAHPQPLGRTRGVYGPPEASLTMFREEFHDLLVMLTTNTVPIANPGLYESIFDVSVQYADTTFTAGQTCTDRIVSCRVKTPEHSLSQSADALVVKLDLAPMRIDYQLGGPMLAFSASLILR